MLPMVGNADEVRHIVNSMKYHPVGKRGVALQVAHDRYRPGAVADKFTAANARTHALRARSRPRRASRTPTRWRRSTASTACGSAISTCRSRSASPASSTTRSSSAAIERTVAAAQQAQQGARPPRADGRAGRRALRAGLRLHLLLGRRLGAAQRAGRGGRQAARRLQVGEASHGRGQVPRRARPAISARRTARRPIPTSTSRRCAPRRASRWPSSKPRARCAPSSSRTSTR